MAMWAPLLPIRPFFHWLEGCIKFCIAGTPFQNLMFNKGYQIGTLNLVNLLIYEMLIANWVFNCNDRHVWPSNEILNNNFTNKRKRNLFGRIFVYFKVKELKNSIVFQHGSEIWWITIITQTFSHVQRCHTLFIF